MTTNPQAQAAEGLVARLRAFSELSAYADAGNCRAVETLRRCGIRPRRLHPLTAASFADRLMLFSLPSQWPLKLNDDGLDEMLDAARQEQQPGGEG